MKTDLIRVTEIIALDKADIVMRSDGSLIANPRVGRIGIQLYQGKELGRPELPVVRVWRPETEVMDKAAMASIAHRPVTNDHPPEAVTTDNWKKYAVGHTGDQVARDGEFVRVPMMLSDAGVIKDFQAGKKELSLGYNSNIEWRSGETSQGEKYDAVQTMIRVNHLAVVDAARGGSSLAIGDCRSIHDESIKLARDAIAAGKVNVKDEFPKDAKSPAHFVRVSTAIGEGSQLYPFMSDGKVYRSALLSIKAQAVTDQAAPIVALADELLKLIDTSNRSHRMTTELKMTTCVVDGVSLEMSDIAASVVLRRVKQLETEAADLHSKLARQLAKEKEDTESTASEKEKAKKKMEEDAATITTLKKQLEDAKLTPQQIDKLVADRGEAIAKARAVLGDKLIIDGKTDADIRRQVVDAKLGDAAKGWTDDQVRSSFTTLTADVKIDQASAANDMRRSFSGSPSSVSDGGKAHAAYDKRIGDAWKGNTGAAA